MEIRPKIDWNKGRALQYLLDTPGFCSSTDVLPIYIGDDKTDEDAFEVHIYIETLWEQPVVRLSLPANQPSLSDKALQIEYII